MPYCGGVDADGVEAALDPVDGLVMLDPAEPLALPVALPDRPCRVRLVVVAVPMLPLDEPIVPPALLPIVEPVPLPMLPVPPMLPPMPGAVELLPVPAEVPLVIEPLAPGEVPPLPPVVWATAADASSAVAVIAIILVIIIVGLLVRRRFSAAGGWSGYPWPGAPHSARAFRRGRRRSFRPAPRRSAA